MSFLALNLFPVLIFAEEETIYINENTFEKINFQSEGKVRIDRFFMDALFDDLSTAATETPPDMGDIPVDGGLGILLTAGLLLGRKKLLKKHHSPGVNRPA